MTAAVGRAKAGRCHCSCRCFLQEAASRLLANAGNIIQRLPVGLTPLRLTEPVTQWAPC